MPRSRGRPPKVMPKHPNKVVSLAVRRGLSAAVELQRNIQNKNTENLYRSSRDSLVAAKDVYYQTVENDEGDHKYVLKAESIIRKNLLKMVMENTAAYGNVEVKRIRNPHAKVGPLNQRFNVLGAQLRNFGMTRYLFPDPELFGYKTRIVGEKRKKYRVAGYPPDSYGPRTPLVHPDLPSLDLVDSIRHHLDYFAGYAFIYDIPPRDAGRYWNLYQLRARPYLDYLYSECLIGKNGFRGGTDSILRELKEDVEYHYETRQGAPKTVTESKTERKPTLSTDICRAWIEEVYSKGITHESIEEFELLVEDESLFREDDMARLHSRLEEKASTTGSRVHEFVFSQLTSPWSLRDAITRGDSYGRSDGYLVCFETPLDTEKGKGKADVILLRRVVSEQGNQAHYRPVMVLDLKTKLGPSITLGIKDIHSEVDIKRTFVERTLPPEYAFRKQEEEKKRYKRVIDYRFGRRPLDDEEWEAFIQAMPDEGTQKQIDTYTAAVWDTYKELTGCAEEPAIFTGTILVDVTEDIRLLRDMLRGLIINAYEEVVKNPPSGGRLVLEPKVRGHKPRIALIMNKREQPVDPTEPPIRPSWRPSYDPLALAQSDGRRFLLYTSAASPTSSGISAAWHAKHYHGLQEIKQIAEEHQYDKIVWIDLASDFIEPELREARLLLRPYSTDEEDTRRTHRQDVQELVDMISFRGLFDEIDSFIFRNGTAEAVGKRLESLPQENCLIVVSGMDTIRYATPGPYRWRLNPLLRIILSQLPTSDSATIFWFDSPVPAAEMSTPYSKRSLLPFYDSSPLRGIVNEIIWNLPVAPRDEVLPGEWFLPYPTKTPMYDDIRVIVRQRKTGFSIESTLVPLLMEWSKRFDNRDMGEVSHRNSFAEVVPDASVRARMETLGLSLIPWLVDLHPTQKMDAKHGFQCILQEYEQMLSEYSIPRDVTTFERSVLGTPPDSAPSLLERVRIRPDGAGGGKAFQPLYVGVINYPRIYHEPQKLKTKPWRLQQKPCPTQDQVEIAHIRFVMILSSYGEEYEWRAVLDPSTAAGIAFGLFPTRETKEGFDWDVQRLDLVRQAAKRFHRFKDVETYILRRKRNPNSNAEKSPEWWIWRQTGGPSGGTFVGTCDYVLRRSSADITLQGFGINPRKPPEGVSVPDIPFPSGFETSFRSTIRDLSEKLVQVQSVKVQLRKYGERCAVKFLDSEGETSLQTLLLKNTVDVLRLLRWPWTAGRPLRIGKLHLTWNTLHDYSRIEPDIDFGEEYGFLESYMVSTSRALRPSLSPLIDDAVEDLQPEQITIYHNKALCPLAKDPNLDHDACWAVELSPSSWRLLGGKNIGIREGLTDKQVGELIDTLEVVLKGRRIVLKFDPGQTDFDRLVFSESEIMRELSAKHRGISMKKHHPGHTARIRIIRERYGKWGD
ncbi:MAG: hypothetical protein GF309_09660 [Candidatus Lokiarchaeota archaeon]|nr:hypothetical protein [Candidatus Lokiarchaeota archaeon]